MRKVITGTGKEITVNWCGRSTIDFVLRMGIPNGNMTEILQIFMNPEETTSITDVFDEREKVYTGFTVFKGVDLSRDGEIVVSLLEV